jgi:hypothetical protein
VQDIVNDAVSFRTTRSTCPLDPRYNWDPPSGWTESEHGAWQIGEDKHAHDKSLFINSIPAIPNKEPVPGDQAPTLTLTLTFAVMQGRPHRSCTRCSCEEQPTHLEPIPGLKSDTPTTLQTFQVRKPIASKVP